MAPDGRRSAGGEGAPGALGDAGASAPRGKLRGRVDPEIVYTIRRSDRARRVRVTVEPDGAVAVTLPRRATRRDAADAVVELRPWIERRRRALSSAQAAIATPPGTLPYLGGLLEVRPEPGRTRAHRRGDVLLVPATDPLPAIERWYRRRARAEVLPRLDAACARAGTRHTGLTIREQRTRWASCSSRGRMSFNWRLLLAPPEILDYVVEHEVCHLEILDHSPRFWALLERRVPGWREHARWLRRYGPALALPEPSTLRNAA
jgi:predicted metal-dependent hydrolase